MSDREQFNVRIDETVANRFRSFVQDHRGDRQGALGQETENALREYMDNDRGARIEANLEILIDEVQELKDLLGQGDPVHTGTPLDSGNAPETIQKLEKIVSEIQDKATNGESVKEEYVDRAIKHTAGANPGTIRRYKSDLKSEGLAFEDPGEPPLWYLKEELFFRKLAQTRNLDEILEQYPSEVVEAFDEWLENFEKGGYK